MEEILASRALSRERDLSQFLITSTAQKKLDDVTETMDYLFSSTLDMVLLYA